MRCQCCCCSHQEACVQAQVTIHTSPPGSPCSPPLPGSCDPGDSFPGRTQGAPQDGATSRRPLLPQASPAFCTPPSPWLSEPDPPISCYFNPFLSGGEQMPSGDLHAKVGPNPKLNPRSCANKEEKGKSLPAASGAVD